MSSAAQRNHRVSLTFLSIAHLLLDGLNAYEAILVHVEPQREKNLCEFCDSRNLHCIDLHRTQKLIEQEFGGTFGGFLCFFIFLEGTSGISFRFSRGPEGSKANVFKLQQKTLVHLHSSARSH